MQSSCHQYADKYVEHEAVLIFLDLLLLRKSVYRHLLFNRLPSSSSSLDGRPVSVFHAKLLALYLCFSACTVSPLTFRSAPPR